MSSLLEVVLKKTLEKLDGTKNYPAPVFDKLSALFTKGRITKNNVLSVLESDQGEQNETP